MEFKEEISQKDNDKYYNIFLIYITKKLQKLKGAFSWALDVFVYERKFMGNELVNPNPSTMKLMGFDLNSPIIIGLKIQLFHFTIKIHFLFLS